MEKRNKFCYYDRSVIVFVHLKYINTELGKETRSQTIAAKKPKKDVILYNKKNRKFSFHSINYFLIISFIKNLYLNIKKSIAIWKYMV